MKTGKEGTLEDRRVMAFLAMDGNSQSADTLNNLSAYTLKNLSAYTLNNLSADTLKNLSPKHKVKPLNVPCSYISANTARRSPSMAKGVGLRLLSRRGSWVQIPPSAPTNPQGF